MNYFEFGNNVKVVSGEGSLDFLAREMERRGGKTALLISDKNLQKLGVTGTVANALKQSKEFKVGAIYLNVERGSSFQCVEEAYEIYRRSGCDCVVACGGGSVIDTAKCLVLMIKTQSRDLRQNRGVNSATLSSAVPFGVVTTNFGSGSDVTKFAVIRDEKRGGKAEFVSELMQPDFCVLDPRMTLTLDREIIALGGIEVLVNAVEAYTSLQSGLVSDRFARYAISLLRDALPRIFDERGENGAYVYDRQARLILMEAGVLAGIAFSNAMVGLAHAFANAVSGLYRDVDHTAVLSTVFIPVLLYNQETCAKKFEELLPVLMDTDVYLSAPAEKRASVFVDSIFHVISRYRENYSLPMGLRSLGVKEEDLPLIAHAAVSDGAVLSNPKRVSEKDALEILSHCM